MQRLIWGHSPFAWHAMFAEVARQEKRERKRKRSKLIREVVETYVEMIELGAALTPELVDAGRALMETMTRGEQIEMLLGIMRRVDDRDRDDALELITALLPYAKPRANAPRGEIAGVSMLDAIVRKLSASAKRRARS